MATNLPTERMLTNLQPATAPANEFFVYCDVQVQPSTTIVGKAEASTNPGGITGDERKYIQSAFLDHLLRTYPQKRKCIRVDESRILSRGGDFEDTHNKEALLVVYECHDPPPSSLVRLDLESLNPAFDRTRVPAFKRFMLPKSHGSGLKLRWARVTFLQSSSEDTPIEGRLVKLMEDHMSDPSWSPKVRMYHMPVDCVQMDVHLDQLVKHAELVDNVYEMQAAQDLINAITSDAQRKQGAIVHGHKIYDKVMKTDRGIDWMFGQSTVHRVSASGEVSTAKRHCVKTFFTPQSVAAFMLDHLKPTDVQHDWRDKQDTLGKMLRGVRINVKTGNAHETRSIISVSSMTPGSVADTIQHAAWKLRGNCALLHPQLLCINIGTRSRPSYIPPEMCKIEYGQSFTGPSDPELQHTTADQRASLAQNAVPSEAASESDSEPEQPTEFSEIVMSHNRTPKLDAERHAELMRRSFSHRPQVLFVEVGSETIHSANWTELRKTLLMRLRDIYNGEARDVRTLSLQYRDSQTVTAQWAEQLRSFVQANGIADRHTVLVVGLRAEKDHAQMYKAIKVACDLQVGVQTVTVNLATLDAQVRKGTAKKHTYHDRGVWQASNGVMRRLRLHKPEALSNNAVQKDLAIAMHVTRIGASEISGAGELQQSWKYLVVLVSRSMDREINYSTDVKLLDQAEMESLDMGKLFERFLPVFQNRGAREKLTIVRSGYILGVGGPPDKPQSPAGEEWTSALRLRHTTESVQPVAAERYTTLDGVPVEAAQSTSIQREINGLKGALEQRRARVDVSYITLKEDRNIVVHPAASVDPYASTDDDLQVATYFNRDVDTFNTGVRSVRVHRKPGMNGTNTLQLSLHGATLRGISSGNVEPGSTAKGPGRPERQTASGAFSPAHPSSPEPKHGRNLVAPTPQSRKSSIAPETPGSETPGRRTFSNTTYRAPRNVSPTLSVLAHRPAPKDGQTFVPDGPVRSDVADGEIRRLARLWVDDRLEMYDTKWPVPTHLAHMATRRAIMHLSARSWGQSAGEPLLPEVHENLRDTLYYM